MKGIRWLRGIGIEIGAHNIPIEGIRPIYVDRFFEFAGSKCIVDIVSDASILPFQKNSLDYVASSHLFEHLPNPILTLLEWYTVLKPGGIIYMVVPDRRFTFDHLRERTSLSHLIQDFEYNTTGCDPAHIGDFIDNVDLSRMMPQIKPHNIPKFRREHKMAYQNSVKAGKEINIHFHVFEKEGVIELIEFMKKYEKTKLSWDIVEVQEKYPPNRGDGFLMVIKVKKNLLKDLLIKFPSQKKERMVQIVPHNNMERLDSKFQTRINKDKREKAKVKASDPLPISSTAQP